MLDLFGFLRRKAAKRTAKQETGDAGERAAARFLKKRGYRILARNVRYPQGEVDLVALEKRAGTLCFVEVRSRALEEGEVPRIALEETVTPAKRRKVIRAAHCFMKQHAGSDPTVRFDVVTVRFTGEDRRRPDVRHYPGAFDATGRTLA
jgi:putative endonuclease